MNAEQAREIQKFVFGLPADESSLICEQNPEYGFPFEMDHYVILAQILLLYDKNLSDQRHALVPEMIEEDDFWFNYFYKIEKFK